MSGAAKSTTIVIAGVPISGVRFLASQAGCVGRGHRWAGLRGRPVRREAAVGTGDQGGVTRPPRGLNLSPRTVDAQIRLRSGRDNRRLHWHPEGQRKPKNDGGAGQQIAHIDRVPNHFGRPQRSGDRAVSESLKGKLICPRNSYA
jgi:hypothetical protein